MNILRQPNLPKIRWNEFQAAFDRNCEKRSQKMNKFLKIIWFQILLEDFEGLLGNLGEDLEDLEDLEDCRCYQ